MKSMTIKVIVGVVLLALLVLPQAVQAQEGQLRLGTQYNHPFGGISAIYDVDDAFAVQGIIGGGAAGKLIYRVVREPMWNIYGYGGGGYIFWPAAREGINAFAGAGVEFDLRHFGVDLGEAIGRPDWVFKPNVELGASLYPGYGLQIGTGFHVSF